MVRHQKQTFLSYYVRTQGTGYRPNRLLGLSARPCPCLTPPRSPTQNGARGHRKGSGIPTVMPARRTTHAQFEQQQRRPQSTDSSRHWLVPPHDRAQPAQLARLLALSPDRRIGPSLSHRSQDPHAHLFRVVVAANWLGHEPLLAVLARCERGGRDGVAILVQHHGGHSKKARPAQQAYLHR